MDGIDGGEFVAVVRYIPVHEKLYYAVLAAARVRGELTANVARQSLVVYLKATRIG